MSENANVFAALLKSTFEVPLPSLNNEYALHVRRMPFSTMTGILSCAAAQLQPEMKEMLSALVESSSDAKTKSNLELGINVVMKLLPSLATFVGTTEYLVKQVLADTIVDSTDALLKTLSTEDALAVLSAVFARMDNAVIAKQVQELFFGMTGVVNAVAALRTPTSVNTIPNTSPESATS